MLAVRTRWATIAASAAIVGAGLVALPVAEAAPALPTAPALVSATSVKASSGARARQLRDRVARIAASQAGDRYIMGATGPGAFDCSGLVVYSYRKATGITLPRTSYSQIAALRHVSARNRAPGDVVFFRGGGHVGIYLGRNRMVHALNSRIGVILDRTDSGWTGSSITGYGRVIQKR